jgi:hypothetical protein
MYPKTTPETFKKIQSKQTGSSKQFENFQFSEKMEKEKPSFHDISLSPTASDGVLGAGQKIKKPEAEGLL